MILPKLLQAATDTWPTYNGDYSGRRFSTLAKINEKTVKELQLAWTFRTEVPGGRGMRIEATPLLVNGIMYFTVPTMVWAVDARTGTQLWSYHWDNKGGLLIGNRGVAINKSTLYFESPDCHLVALDIVTGKEKWNTSICSLELMILLVDCSRSCEGPCHRGCQRRRLRHSRLSGIARPRDRQAAMALVCTPPSRGRRKQRRGPMTRP